MNRDTHVDIIKGWAMLTIIVFHCSQTCLHGLLAQLLGNPWNVPIFFIVGGFFLKEQSLGQLISFIKGKFLRLYLPATIIYGLCVLFHNLFVSIGWYPLGEVHPASGVLFSYYGLKEIGIGLAKVLAVGGSGELAMGAMWFLYALLYAFVGMAIVYWIISKIVKNVENRFYWMTVVLLLIGVISCTLTQNYNFTISRFSSALTAMALLWWGMIIYRKWEWTFEKWWALAVAIIVFVHCILQQKVDIKLAHNDYQDLINLITGSTAAIYIWGFIGKRIENLYVGRFLALMGRESLYLMAFHIVGFFLCNTLMVWLGVFGFGDEKGLYTYNIGDNWLILLVYVFFGVFTPLLLINLYRKVKSYFLKYL